MAHTIANAQVLELGHKILHSEIAALKQIDSRLDGTFVQAVEAILACKGQVVLTGVGKSYFIAQKISASLASTGTASIALHPVDGLHGDLGRLKTSDIVLILSNSGSSPEIVNFAQACRALQVPCIAMTCNAQSQLARHSQIVLDLGFIAEACFMGLAPSSTTTAMLALGDALALTVAELRGFTAEAFAKFHPAGHLGLRLQPVEVAMRGLERTAYVQPSQNILLTLEEITKKRCGAAFVVDANQHLQGVFTDGDLRRLLAQGTAYLKDPVEKHMTRSPKYVVRQQLVESALETLREYRIDELPVVDAEHKLLGHIDIQDLA